MKLSIIGKGTLAQAVAECCADHFDVFVGEHAEARVVWICHDTPIDARGVPDTAWVIAEIRETMKVLNRIVKPAERPLILLSSQMPVGTTQLLEREFSEYEWAVSPENIRVATATEDFRNQPRVVVGTRHPDSRFVLEQIFEKFTRHIIFTDPATAEMVKHALNTFLGLQIAFINEVARIAHVVGADPSVITTGLRTDFRVSPNAPLRAGAPFGGGHLARDIFTLSDITKARHVHAPIINHITESNEGTPHGGT